MNYSNPSNIGLIACPGGERFTELVAKSLAGIYKRRFERKTKVLAERYGISLADAVRQMNFSNDTQSNLPHVPGDIGHYRGPRLKIHTRYSWFANGEVKAEIQDSPRGKDIYICQDVENRLPCSFNDGREQRELSVNDHIFCLMTTIDAAVQAGARRISLVLPTYPYSRQHKKKGREGLTAARFGQIMEYLGVARIITLDIHSREIENCFNHLRLENLHASYQIIEKLAGIIDVSDENLVVVSPDTGAVDRNKFYASTLQRPLALLYKERDYSRVSTNATDNNITEMRLLGDVRGKTVFMADDMLGTGGTMLKAMRFLKEQGAKQVICAISLPLFSSNAHENFDAAYREGHFLRIIGTNAVAQSDLLKHEWYIEANVSPLFAQIISLLHQDRSLSPMLDNRDMIARKLKKAISSPLTSQAPPETAPGG
ncbi:MAG: phosphoribosylpyrophosphate synthetase [Spirochaetes bacterium GWD1_61_31]|nr:MAG: phosphoribosylpyrophosphate synthetase [Spirochaetes bacterium GWB1_60_80]OHD29749.1 MAG: phosphoribosylpyrophosphate synthetase [Spirochaetes bacterium GWC1_61_12]OHD35771.1 MAG: phosphoribosylpyrophosphate synthetase [Spirochaetes bacterium GWD1_61_31]OHD42909.1 MAG: phosphoribosylpyrophosphate synthetase [Spirochaetes bacterium GWE1_60_18]OHD61292.1 MAG: phosphoribosylpyrophosphate synthetase [Spirochaetes bacterium GWF1_60_12]HAP43775.1 phosphoribosylpyrophosphate synthetase [Spiro